MQKILLKNIKILKVNKDLTNNDLADILGVSLAVVKNYLRGKTPIPLNQIKALSSKTDTDIDWLLHGGTTQVNEPEIAYDLKNRPSGKLIPYFDVDVMLTPIEVFNDQTTVPAYQIDVPGFADCEFAINVFGHSMYPTIESGTIVFCKEIKDKSLIIPGEVYFVVTNDYRMVKRLLRSEKTGHITASSDNHNGHGSPDGKTYGSVDIPISKILHLYIVKGNIKRNSI